MHSEFQKVGKKLSFVKKFHIKIFKGKYIQHNLRHATRVNQCNSTATVNIII